MKYPSLDKYKTDINLVDFMLQDKYGFQLTKTSTYNFPRIAKYGNSGAKEELYVIKRNEKGFFTYWSPYDESLSGKTIIDFVQDQHKEKNGTSIHLGKVRKILDAYMKGEKYVVPAKSDFQINSFTKENDKFKLNIKNCRPYTDREYLHSRGILDSTIDNPMFSGLIKNIDYIKKTYDNTITQKFTNTAFLMYNLKGINAINIKNKTNGESFSGCYGNRGESIIASRIDKNRDLDKLILNESFDDSLSHFQLNENEYKNLNVKYMATAGSLCEGQISLIEEFLKKQKTKELVFGFDNDLSGNFFRAKLLGKLQINQLIGSKEFLEEDKSFAFAHIDCKREKRTGYVDFIFANSDRVNGIENITKLKSFIEIYNEKHRNSHIEGEPFKFAVKLADDNKAIGQISFQNLKDNWNIVSDLIHEIKYEKNKFFSFDVPISKDFNDDLNNKLSKKNDLNIT